MAWMGSDSKSKECSGAEIISTWEEPGMLSDVLIFVGKLKMVSRKQKVLWLREQTGRTMQ